MTGDNYARDWVAGAWRSLGFEYIRSPQPKGAVYLESLPVFTRGLARLPDHTRLVRELRLLERRTHRSGKDTVEHPRNGHDDYANVVCGMFHLLTPAVHEQPAAIVSPIVAGEQRYVPGGSSFASDVLIMPTLGALTAPPQSPAESTPNFAPARSSLSPSKHVPPQTVSGDEAKRRMAAVNGDKSAFYRNLRPARPW